MKALALTLLIALPCQAQQNPTLEALQWLAGCWAQQGREPGSIEQWMAPAGASMLGMARTVKGGRTVEFEFMQLRSDANGRLLYIAQPQGRPPTEFALTRQSAEESVFENPAHDFPQRVIYRLSAPDRLNARIEGVLGGKPRAIDFPMQRVAC